MEQFSIKISKGDIAKYEVYSDTVNDKYIAGEDVRKLEQRDGVQEVYCQRLCTEIKCKPDQKSKYYAVKGILIMLILVSFLIIYSIVQTNITNNKEEPDIRKRCKGCPKKKQTLHCIQILLY